MHTKGGFINRRDAPMEENRETATRSSCLDTPVDTNGLVILRNPKKTSITLRAD